MFNYEDFYKLYNCRAEARYREDKEQLAAAVKQMSGGKERGFKEKILSYTRAQGEYLLLLTKLEEKWTAEYIRSASLAELKKDQALVFGDLSEEKYGKSYANPSHMTALVGKELGPVLAALAKGFKDAFQDAYCHRRFLLADILEFYLELQKKMLHGPVKADVLASLWRRYQLEHVEIQSKLAFHKEYNVSNAGWTDCLMQEDLQQPYYLYQLGIPVSEQEESLHRFFAALPQEEIEQIARSVTEGFRKGFIRDNKEIRKKKSVAIEYPMGMERLVKQVMQIFRGEMELEPFITRIESAGVNQQYGYDHRFDAALYLNEAYCEKKKSAIAQLVEENQTLLKGYGGVAVIESFGEKPFEPVLKGEVLKLSERQSELMAAVEQYQEQELYQVGKLSESSYTIAALPVPAIGEQFEEIFHEVVRINSMSEEHLAKAQHSLIGTLDRGTAVYIRGRGSNETDLQVALQPLENPRRQTNFFNCLADVNIPAGEVFTSPQLFGTSGLLHVEKAYLKGLCYENLKLTFEDGYITDYSCTNFADEEQGKAYIYENLLHPHDSLPMGEFAIGTNTWAYCMAQKYQILSKLPVLIVEKLGPHFAIGDTCFSYEEDQPVFNPMDHKEITARDNERSILRKTEPEKAYTQKHIDITLPYESIGLMCVVKSSGDEIDLIREGRFVLIGTDILNAPIMAMENQLEGEIYVTNL